jgi:hypothetical protein
MMLIWRLLSPSPHDDIRRGRIRIANFAVQVFLALEIFDLLLDVQLHCVIIHHKFIFLKELDSRLLQLNNYDFME